MTRRAVILVPGLTRLEQLEARDRLVRSISDYTGGYETVVSEAKDSGEGFNSVHVDATSREDGSKIKIDVFEAYWGDLRRDWSGESPVQRFLRGSKMLFYWAFGGVLKAAWRRELPTPTFIGLLIAGLLLLMWYLNVCALLLAAYLAQPGDHALLNNAMALIGYNKEQSIALASTLREYAQYPLYVFVIGLLGSGGLDKLAAAADFVKSYLRDDALSPGETGLRAKTRKRVLAALDHVHNQTNPPYDEIFVVAHSLGGAVAVDALAEYGKRLESTVLITWGSALGALVQQEPLIEDEIAKLYKGRTKIFIANWIDVVFRSDMMASRVPVPRKHKQQFPPTIQPRMPRGTVLSFKRKHEGYYNCQEAIVMLVQPATKLPAFKPSAETKGEKKKKAA